MAVTHLTTAMASNAGSNFLAATGGVTGTNITGTIYSNGLSLSVAAPGGPGGGGVAIYGGTTSQSTGTVTFANANGVTFGLETNGSMTASVQTNYQTPGAYLTTAALSNHSHNLATTTTNGSLIVVATTNSNGATFAVPPFLTTAQAPGAYLTTARASNDAIGLNTALTANGLSVTANSSGLSINVPAWLTTAMQSASSSVFAKTGFSTATTAGTALVGTLNTNGLSMGVPAWLTTAALSDHSHGNPTLALTNLTGTTASASNGFTLSLSAAAPGAGAAVTVSASNGSFTVGNLNFSNANNVTFGTSAGSIITASVAAPGAAAENNWMTLLGANVSSNSSASGSTIGLSGSNVTLAGTNGSQIIISAPATSSISAINGFYISANASTISMGQNVLQFYEPQPLMSTNTSTFAPSIGTWYFQPMHVPNPLASGRMNFLVSHGSTSNLLNLSNGANFASNTTGGRSLSFNHSYMAALYTRGAGANSTRWDSIWSNTWGLSISHSVGVSVTNASQITHSQQLTMNFVSQVGTDGAYTLGGIGQSHSASTAASSVATTAFTSGRSSWQNMVSGAMLIPMGFNTSLTPGNYLLGIAYSTASTTAGTAINGASIWPVVNMMGFNKFASYSHRQFGSTASSTGSQYFMPQGMFSVASASAPATIDPRDIRSFSNNVFPYVNFMQSNFN